MPRSTLVPALLLLAALQPPARTRPDIVTRKDTTRRRVVAFADTAAVRRVCEQPDSVIAGRKTCVLRSQTAFNRF